jgi:hypothetical protein
VTRWALTFDRADSCFAVRQRSDIGISHSVEGAAMKYKMNLSADLNRKYGLVIAPTLETIMKEVKPFFDGPISNGSEVYAETTEELRNTLLATGKTTALEVDEILALPMFVVNSHIYVNRTLTGGMKVTISTEDKELRS